RPQLATSNGFDCSNREIFTTSDGPDALGKIHCRPFSAADLRRSHRNFFHRLCPGDDSPALVGWTRILVLLARRVALADRLYGAATASPALRFWTRTYSRSLDLVNGRPRQPISRWPRRWSCGH